MAKRTPNVADPIQPLSSDPDTVGVGETVETPAEETNVLTPDQNVEALAAEPPPPLAENAPEPVAIAAAPIQPAPGGTPPPGAEGRKVVDVTVAPPGSQGALYPKA